MSVRVVLTGAGSGGHIYPLVAVGTELKKQVPDGEILYIGTHAQLGHLADAAMKKEGIAVKHISAGKMRRYFSLQYFADFFRLPLGVIQSLWHLLVFMPDAVFSKGGYASVPVVFAAWIYRIPVLTHESDAVPGWANRINGKFSHYIALSFPEAKRYFVEGKAIVTGSPIRAELTQGSAERARERWGLSTEWPTVLVFGGSQGSLALNASIVEVLPSIMHQAQVLHITGEDHFEGVREEAAKQGFKTKDSRYVAVPILGRDEMADAYALADMSISRAGANSIAELAANKLPAILVPIAVAANNHQYLNAYSVAKRGGAVVLEEANLGQHILTEKIQDILTQEELRKKLSENIAQFYHPDAIEKIVAGIFRMIR